jgi:NADPH-dependent F420 reductase
VSRTVAVLGGTGPEGSGLALRWARAGESIIIGSRDPKRAQAAAARISSRTGAEVRGEENSVACAGGDVVVLTVPFSGHAELLKSLKNHFKPQAILIDATVPLAAAVGDRPTRTLGLWQGSAAQQAAELVPKGVLVAGAFQNVSAVLLDGEGPIDCDVIVCSDSADAMQAARELADKIPGLRSLDGGKLENARIVEEITALLITLNIRQKSHHAGLRITGLP